MFRVSSLKKANSIRKYTWKQIQNAPLNDLGCHFVYQKHTICGAEHVQLNVSQNVTPSFSVAIKTPSNVDTVHSLLLSKMFQQNLNFSSSNVSYFRAHRYPTHTVYTISSVGNMKEAVSFLLKNILKPTIQYSSLFYRDTENKVAGQVYDEIFSNEQNADFILRKEMFYRLYKNTGTPFCPPNTKDLSEMTLESLYNYHSKHYHPSRMCFITSGPETFDKQIQEAIQSYSQVTFPELTPIRKVEHLIVQTDGPKSDIPIFGVSWLLNDASISYETSLFSILSKWVLNYQFSALSSFENCQMNPYNSGFDTSHQLTCFNLVYQGKIPSVRSLNEKINDFQNIPTKSIFFDPILTGAEIHLRRMVYGDELLPIMIASFWNNGRDVVNGLNLTNTFTKLRNEISNGAYLKTIQKYFNTWQLVSLNPVKDPQFFVHSPPFENQILTNQFTKAEPTNQKQVYNVTKETDQISYNQQETNGLIHVTVKSLKSVTKNEKSFLHLPMTCFILEKIGCRELNSYQFWIKIQSICSDFGIKPFIEQDPNDLNKINVGALFHFTCLKKDVYRVSDMMEAIFSESMLFSSLSHETNVVQVVSDLLSSLNTQIQQDMNSNFLDLLKIHSGMSISPFVDIGNTFSGEMFHNMMNALLKADKSEVVNILQTCAKSILNQNRLQLLITTDLETKPMAIKAMSSFVDSIPTTQSAPYKHEFRPKSYREALPLKTEQSLVCMSMLTTPMNHPDTPAIFLISQILALQLRSIYLVDFSLFSGVLSISTPNATNVEDALQFMENFTDIILQNQFTDQFLESARNSCLKQLDAPVGPHELGYYDFLYQWSCQNRTQFRARLLECNRETILSATKRYLMGDVDWESNEGGITQGTSRLFKNITLMTSDDKIPSSCKTSRFWKYYPSEPRKDTTGESDSFEIKEN